VPNTGYSVRVTKRSLSKNKTNQVIASFAR